MNSQSWAILWAQWRTLRNFYPRTGKFGLAFTILITMFWYGLWVMGAVAVSSLVSEARDMQLLYRFLAPGLFLALLYWQIIPILMVSTGASLQIRRLMVYPIPRSKLFQLEVMLRVTTAIEMLLLIIGATVGLLRNPVMPVWHAIAFVPYLAFNLYLSTGIRDVITRMLAWRRLREVTVFAFLILVTIPQIFLRSADSQKLQKLFQATDVLLWPWSAAAKLVVGEWTPFAIAASLFWLAFAYAFGRYQFEKSLNFDEQAARAQGNQATGRSPWMEKLYAIPQRLLPDRIAVILEKDLRSLMRSPRFRIVFLMGFSFGLLVWLPMAFGRTGRSLGTGMIQTHFLTVTSAYAIMLLSEVCIWNVFGFERTAAQVYWVTPVRIVDVLIAKNLATVFFVTMEILIIAVVCKLFGLQVTPLLFFESFLVCLVLLIFLLAIGNVSSLRFPRPMDPNDSWKRSSASRFQAMLLLLYPILSLPFLFAYYARTVWDSSLPFYGVIFFMAGIGAICYGFSMEDAVAYAEKQKEKVLASLAQGGSPLAT